MGLFDKMKEGFKDLKETDVSKMNFERCDGFAGSVPQKFVDQSIPVCPICKENPHWLTHGTEKIVKVFPVTITDMYYYAKCEKCGLTIHTVMRSVNGNEDKTLYRPNPRDNTTVYTFDVLGDKAADFSLAGKEMSIFEINQMAQGS